MEKVAPRRIAGRAYLMHVRATFTLAALLLAGLAGSTQAAPRRIQLAPPGSEVAFRAYGLGLLPIDASFARFDGWLTYDPDGGTDMGPVVSGSMKKCEGGYPGVFDMVGNIKEWENACNGTTGASDICRRRGGGFNELDDPSTDCAYDETDTRNFRSYTSGIRCCAKPQ